MHDTIDWPVAFLGCLYAGVVPVAVNTLLTPADYAYMLVHSRAQAAFVSSALAPTLTQAMNDAPHEVKRVVETSEFSSLTARHAPAPTSAPTAADDIGFWLYSSGSTGKPKGTVHTHANLYWTAELYGKPVLGLREDDVCSRRRSCFSLRAGQRADVPAVGRRDGGADGRAADAGCGLQASGSSTRPDHFLRRAHVVRRHARVARAASAHASRAAHRCVGRRGAAEGHRRALQGALRLRGSRRHRLDRDAAHLPFQPRGTRALRHHRHAGARLRDRAARRTRAPWSATTRWRLVRQGTERGTDVLGQPREIARDIPRRVDQERRQVRREAATATTPTPAAATTC